MLTLDDEFDPHSMAVRVYNLRRALGMSREELAEASDLSVNTITSIESGNKDIRISTLRKLAIGLHCTTDYLLFGGSQEQVALESKTRSVAEEAIRCLDPRKLSAFTNQAESLLRMVSSL